MRVLLINPFYPISETPSPPLGLAYLAAALTEAGNTVKILDLVVYPYSQVMLQHVLETFQPQIVGLTAVTMTFDNALGVICDIKRLNPDILTVMGGPHVTFCARETSLSIQPWISWYWVRANKPLSRCVGPWTRVRIWMVSTA